MQHVAVTRTGQTSSALGWLTRILFFGLIVWLVNQTSWAEPVAVRFTEGATHGYLSLETEDGRPLAQGELVQRTQEFQVKAHLFFHFFDGSIHDEWVIYSQRGHFRLESYRLTESGLSFPKQQDITIDRKKKRFSYRAQTQGRQTIERSGTLSLPNDVYNGMIITALKNLPSGQSATISYLTFTPQPKVVALVLTPTHHLKVGLGHRSTPVTHYQLEPQLGLLTSLVGKLLGRLPAVFHYHAWVLADEVPAFVAFEGPLYVNGPIWRIKQTVPSFFLEPDSKGTKILTTNRTSGRK